MGEIKANRYLEFFGSVTNDKDGRLPKGRGRCFDIGTWGGCGVTCAAFVDGECGEPQEIPREDVESEHGTEDAETICSYYDCYDQEQSDG